MYRIKSRLLPLAPFEAGLEWLVEKLPRKRVRCDLKPAHAIDVIDAVRGEYRANGRDPCFTLSLDVDATRGGWFYVEGALVRNNGDRVANIHVQVSGGSDKDYIWPITTNLRGTIREVIHLPPNVTELRWQPTGSPGYFSQSPLLIHAISNIESVARRIYRIALVRRQTKEWSNGWPATPRFWKLGAQLQAAYRHSAELRASQIRGTDYQAFLRREARNLASSTRELRKMQRGRPDFDLLSVALCPIELDEHFVKHAVMSVLAQLHRQWELLIVYSTDVGSETFRWMEQLARTDHRVRLIDGSQEGDMAGKLNLALHQARGVKFARLGARDLMLPSALLRIACEGLRHPEARLIYSDEDRVDNQGVRSDPAFKPDWNPDLLLSHNYIGNLAFCDRQLLLGVEGYRCGLDGAEDFDLWLRLKNCLQPAHIRHVPEVLVSRRLPTSPQAEDAALQVLNEHLAPFGAAAVQGHAPGFFKVAFPLPDPLPLVSIIIPTRDRLEVLRPCIESIRCNTDYSAWEMLIVDNQSDQPDTLAYLSNVQGDPRIRVLHYDMPFNYSAINNFAVEQARGRVVALLNNDVEVIAPGWLAEMVSHAIRPEIGAVGAKLLYANGLVQHAGVVLGIGGIAGHAHRFLHRGDSGYRHRAAVIQNFSAVTGACMVVERSRYQLVGGMNERDLVVALNDVDFCLKLQDAGYRNVWLPDALLYHHESISRGKDDTPEKQAILHRESQYLLDKWGPLLRSDPAYNINLTTQFEDFSFNMAP